MTRENIIFILILILLLSSFITIGDGIRCERLLIEQNERITSLEGRIMLQEGKATLTNSPVCIIHEEGLEDPDLAYQLVNACLSAKAMRDEGEL